MNTSFTEAVREIKQSVWGIPAYCEPVHREPASCATWELDAVALKARDRERMGIPGVIDPELQYGYELRDGMPRMIPIGQRTRQPVSFTRLSIAACDRAALGPCPEAAFAAGRQNTLSTAYRKKPGNACGSATPGALLPPLCLTNTWRHCRRHPALRSRGAEPQARPR